MMILILGAVSSSDPEGVGSRADQEAYVTRMPRWSAWDARVIRTAKNAGRRGM
jgi:hypothetical protein